MSSFISVLTTSLTFFLYREDERNAEGRDEALNEALEENHRAANAEDANDDDEQPAELPALPGDADVVAPPRPLGGAAPPPPLVLPPPPAPRQNPIEDAWVPPPAGEEQQAAQLGRGRAGRGAGNKRAGGGRARKRPY